MTRIAGFGCRFWAQFQIAWRELPNGEAVALYNPARARAAALAVEVGVA